MRRVPVCCPTLEIRIPADELPTIFDEYRQAEGWESSVQNGTGLGLSITKKFVELRKLVSGSQQH